MLTFELARPQDAAMLANVQKRTFDDDARRYQDKEEDGPPGYDSVPWQAEQMQQGHYYKLLKDGGIVGGMIIFPSPTEEECHLGRIFIDPLYQNQGFGHEALHFLLAKYPRATRWTLDTPSWAVRNHHFYEKHGFVRTGEIYDAESSQSIWEYERTGPLAEVGR
ncbi:GNAT family N-acetyltransferase [Paenibacillus sp. FSL H3-0333]|uniref:GNAT family N-acetyltransferase n=1 Tax=Paenibacillus sp. FSL H3-0333 TaxID=2921373 RepID=UPI0030F6B2D3